jgi:hypothetical protein
LLCAALERLTEKRFNTFGSGYWNVFVPIPAPHSLKLSHTSEFSQSVCAMWRGRSLTLAAASGVAVISARHRRDAAQSKKAATAPNTDLITKYIEKQLGEQMVEVGSMLQNLYTTFADELNIPVEDRHKVLLSAAVVKVTAYDFQLQVQLVLAL